MKKIFYFAMAALAGALLVSCEPTLIDGPDAKAPIGASELQSSFVIDGQFADAACTIPQADGNYIKYHTSPARTVQVYNFKADGSKNVLTTGASGVFNITPKRGADPNQTFSVAAINQDASIISFDSSVNVFVPGDLDPEMKILVGESGEKAWKWYTIDGACWGNAGYLSGSRAGADGSIPGYWWGCTPEQLETEQLAHTGGTVYGYGDSNAYMVLNEDGMCTSYKANGEKIAGGTFTVKNYDPQADNSLFSYGQLVTTDAPILMPFKVNQNGTRANEYEILYMDPNMLILMCPGPELESWKECTWWRFKNASDADAALAGLEERSWTWKTIDGATWGNAGYLPGGTADAEGTIPGYWWGCTPEQLETEQLAHSGGVAYGYGSDDAYMTFNSKQGTVTSYKADGTKIAESPYSVENFDMSFPDGYTMGTLTTGETASGIMFPFKINQNGAVATEYQILYLDGTSLTLMVPGPELESWKECTWWRFQPKH